MNNELLLVARKWFDFWMANPEKENWLFNEAEIPINLIAYVYAYMVSSKLILPIEKLETNIKNELKMEVLRIDPTRSVVKGIMMAKTIYVFSYLSNN